MTAEGEYYARRGAEIAGITLAVLVPFFCLGFCCCRRHRRNHKAGLENKTLKKLTTSRHSISEAPIPVNTIVPTANVQLVKKNRIGSSSGSSGISSNPPDGSSASNNTSEASPPLGSGPIPPSPLSSSVRASPSNPSVTSGSAYGGGGGAGGNVTRPKRYDGVYYTHEPIRGAPQIDFEEKTMDVEINHRNTEV